MVKMSGHSTCSVMFRQTIRCEYIRKTSIVVRSVGVIGPLFSICCGIGVLTVERVLEQRFQRFIVCRQGTILQAARNVQPTNAVGMQSEGSRTAKGFYTFSVMEIRRSIGRRVLVIIGVVEARPLPFHIVPPNKFLFVAPRCSIRAGGGAIVKDAAIVWPGEPPAMTQKIFGVAFVGAITMFLGKDAAVDPSSTGGGTIVF